MWTWLINVINTRKNGVNKFLGTNENEMDNYEIIHTPKIQKLLAKISTFYKQIINTRM